MELDSGNTYLRLSKFEVLAQNSRSAQSNYRDKTNKLRRGYSVEGIQCCKTFELCGPPGRAGRPLAPNYSKPS
ncbi:unnamed protein product, partial [Nesidiocoris tenuis]